MATQNADRTAGLSPLAPSGGFPDVPAIAGVTLATAAAGIRYRHRDDVMLATIAPGSTIAGVLTRSETRSASVRDCQVKLAALAGTNGSDSANGAGRLGVLACAGNANTFTGRHGASCVDRIAQAVASRIGTSAEKVFTAFTGVIGERLTDDRVCTALDSLVPETQPGSGSAVERAAAAIMTTDTFPKGAGQEIELDGGRIGITGIAKGSGMIAPDMATLLAFVFTDARVSQDLLQETVETANATSFNAITVDGDTSTSDTLLVAATGRSGIDITRDRPDTLAAFQNGLASVMQDLAQQVVRDGEGASKFVAIEVTGARSPEAARRVALAVANSPLVKTAIAGEDPNWGRIVMAVGKSGEAIDADRLVIRFGDTAVATGGEAALPADVLEATLADYMRRPELRIGIDLGAGDATATIWTCDLTRRYIEINADYRS
ncbi:MAG: bifunctional glutamate N-acetyltransferase/amino-acid acetyltransferase ArgJ [Paracoccaceae bacterium]|nr:bifunctional glutamate N-acetyltransferase/amino-acid acetyltransferase ArgJ [Paracoccaceae bacterium]